MALRNVILTMLARRKMTGYEIAREFDQVYKYFWTATHQQIYRELGKLHEDECVSFREVPQKGKPDKKLYSITKAGRAELKDWLAKPCDPYRPKFEFMVKLLGGTVVSQPAVRQEVERVKTETDAFLEQTKMMERECLGLPFESMSEYERMLYLGLRRGLLMIQAQHDWLEEVEEYFKSGKLKR